MRWIIVVGAPDLEIGGEATSMGRLLLTDRVSVSAEGGDALYVSKLDGETYRGDYAHLFTGARLSRLLGDEPFATVVATDDSGEARTYAAAEVSDAIVATVNGRPALVLPGASRSNWTLDLSRIEIGS